MTKKPEGYDKNLKKINGFIIDLVNAIEENFKPIVKMSNDENSKGSIEERAGIVDFYAPPINLIEMLIKSLKKIIECKKEYIENNGKGGLFEICEHTMGDIGPDKYTTTLYKEHRFNFGAKERGQP